MGQRIRRFMPVRSGRIVVRELDYGERYPEHVHIANTNMPLGELRGFK
jgi:hypothetical protein